MVFDFNKAVFTYAVSTERMNFFHCSFALETRDVVINYTDATKIYHASGDGCEIVIIGLCVDSRGTLAREAIAYEIIHLSSHDIDTVYHFSDRLGGKYAIIYSNDEGCYAFGDATCSIPLNYSGSLESGEICISPFDKMTAEYFGYVPDPKLKQIREAADPAQTMPGDLTPYREVKALLPNQFLNLSNGKAVRQKAKIPELLFKDVIDHSILISRNLAEEYAKYYEVICPLTSGYDSRAVLAIQRQVSSNVACFTTRFSPSAEENADLQIAAEICNRKEIEYTVFGYNDPPAGFTEAVEKVSGLINSKQTIAEAYNYVLCAGEKARINGNIIGQIGKSSVTNSVPNFLATAAFLSCKIHNRDKQCIDEMKTYIGELKKSGEAICDLFAWENRCGRWGGQEEALYSICGMNSLNVFNCRELILCWMAVPRKQRTQKAIHREMIWQSEPDLLTEPFNPDDKYSFLKENWVFYYAATFVKQALIRHNIQCD